MTDELTKVRRLLPPSNDPSRTAHANTRQPGADEILLQQILATPIPEASQRWLIAKPRRSVLAGCLVLCAAVLVAILTPWPGPGSGALAALPIRPAVVLTSPAEPDPTAADVLESAAVAAARQPELPPSSIRYRRVMAGYLRTIGGERPASVLAPETVETWLRPDGSAEIRHEGAAPIWPSEIDRKAWNASGAPVPDTTRTDHIRNADTDARGYSANPLVLAAQLDRQLPREDRAARTLMRLRDIRNASAAPDLRAATFRVAAQLPGIKVFGSAVDQLGRPGVAVGVDSDYSGKNTRYELLIGPEGELLEYQELLLEPAAFVRARPPVQIAFEIEVAGGAARAVGSRP